MLLTRNSVFKGLRKEHRLRVFENRALRGMCGLKWKFQGDGERKLHNEELRNLYSSPDIIRMVKSSEMLWAGCVACMGKKKCIHDFGWKS
jgi:hypothetical protein